MKTQSLFQAVVISIFAFGLTACPQNTGKNKKSPGVKRVKGDPHVFIKNAAMNGNTPLPYNVANSATSWELAVAGFAEGSAEVDTNTLVQEQAPKEKQESKFLSSEIRGNQWVISGVYQKTTVKLIFHRAGEGWILQRYEADGKSVTLGAPKSDAVVHTSITPDQTAFSLLLQDKTMGERSVISLTLTHAKPAVKRMGDAVYEFLYGKGVKVGWRRDVPLKILICGSLPAILPQIVNQAAAAWSKALEGRMELKTATQVACPPFSDLNTRTFSFTTEWIEIAGEDAVTAQALTLTGPGQENLLDTDIFYLLGEYQEELNAKGIKENVLSPEFLSKPGLQASILRTSIHELGHSLGLHHQFNPSIDSIMSYSKNREPKLYDYDVKAIQHLYSD
jgi:predicted Zn-dependent protease